MPKGSSSSADPNSVQIDPVQIETRLVAYIRQLQQQYPNSALITEFITYAVSEYAVRAVVQVGDQILATGMAASSNLETAEDRARVRAIETLVGIHERIDGALGPTGAAASIPSPSSPNPIPGSHSAPLSKALESPSSPPTASPRPKPTKRGKSSRTSKEQPAVSAGKDEHSPNADQVNVHNVHQPNANQASKEDLHIHWNEAFAQIDPSTQEDPFLDDLQLPDNDLPNSELPRPDSHRDLSMVTSPTPTPELSQNQNHSATEDTGQTHETVGQGNNVNLVDAIAKTSVEMHRLGWDTHQGRQHLQATYGKRSRGELTDDELLDFLKFLEQQPNPTVP